MIKAKGFVVVEGSQAVKDEVQTIPRFVSTMRKDLLDQGVTVDNGQQYVFTQDQVFNSPSTAASVVMGRNANGRIEWKASDGRTLREIQEAVSADAGKEGGP